MHRCDTVPDPLRSRLQHYSFKFQAAWLYKSKLPPNAICLAWSVPRFEDFLAMRVHSVIRICLFCLVPSIVLGYNSVPPSTGPGIADCFPELCWVDAKGSGFMAGEPLAGHLTPHTKISINNGWPTNRTGEIVLDKPEYEAHLGTAVLGRTILLYPAFDRFKRYITDSAGKDIGFMNMERPVPDPDTRFQKLAQDPLLDSIPKGLRSALDPASLIPSRTESCGTKPTNCFLVIPVSVTTSLYHIHRQTRRAIDENPLTVPDSGALSALNIIYDEC